MPYLLNLVYATLLLVASPWIAWQAARTGKYRKGWLSKLAGEVPRRAGRATCVWIHAVSLGEVSLIGSLVAEIRRRHPAWEICISTTTLTGHALAKTRYPELAVFYFPLDFTWAVNRSLDRIRPDVLVLAELELWPNLIRAARRRKIKVAVVNGRLSDRSFRGYARFGRFVRSVFAQLDLVATQNQGYAERFTALGSVPERVHVTGSLKFDGAQTDRGNAATTRLRELAGHEASDVVFLAGSTQDPEERLAIEAYQHLSPCYPQLRLIIVPRHPERFAEVAHTLTVSGLIWEKRSSWESCGGNRQVRVLLVDQVGELAAWWGTATCAYVGGSMGERQGQNMIEPAAYGCAVSFGPKTRNFRDVVVSLLAAEAATVVHDGHALTAFVERCLAEPAFAAEQGRRAAAVVASQIGATARTVDLLESLLGGEQVRPLLNRAAA